MKEQPTPPMAESLNKDITAPANCVMDLLSERGRLMYFPFKGILGQSAEAKGKGINATIGTAFEDDGSAMVLDCVKSSLNVPAGTFLYTPSFGLPDIREEWRSQILRKNPSLEGKVFSLPVVTGALTHALYLAGFLFVNEGDEIVMPDFYWDNYELIFNTSFGAKISTFQTFDNDGYNVKGMIEKLRSSSSQKKILLLNFPNNPTGYTVTEDEAMQIKEGLLRLASEGSKMLVILDDAYFGLAYEKCVYRESLFAMFADLHENILALKLDGPTKEDYVWSFRVGFATFAVKNADEKQLKALEAKTAGAVRGSISNCSGIGQAILLKAYRESVYAEQKARKLEVLKRRYRRVREILSSHPEYAFSFEPLPFNSGYFMCVKCKDADPEAVRKELLEKYDTGVIVLSGVIRIAFSAVPLDKLNTLFSNIHSAISNLQKNNR